MTKEDIFEVSEFLFNGKEDILRRVQGLASYVQNPVEYTQRDLEQFSDDYLDTVEELKVWADSIGVFMVSQMEEE